MHLPGVESPHFFRSSNKGFLVCDAADANIKHLLLYTIVRQDKNKNRIIPIEISLNAAPSLVGLFQFGINLEEVKLCVV